MSRQFKFAPKGVGLLIVERARRIDVDLLIVAPHLRGRGLGTMALRRLQLQGRPIRLTATPDRNKKRALHRFYQRLGFRAVRKDCAGQTEFEWTPAK